MRGKNAHRSLQTSEACVCTQASHRQTSGHLWEPWHKDCCFREEPPARRCCAVRVEHVKHPLVPPGLAVGIQARAART